MRVGLHSGLSEDDVAASQEGKGRVKYVGRALAMAKAMCDSGHGGMVLLSEACHTALVPASGIAAHGHVLHLGQYRFDAMGESAIVYMAVAQDARARVALLLRKPLRGVTQTQPGALRAPAGSAAVAFVNVVGAASLSAWDGAVANRAFAVLHKHARHLLTLPQPDGEADGYAVKMHEGLCLCSFHSALAALLWSTHLVNALRLLTEWEPALLAHELCEEVAVTATDLANAPTSGILSGAALLSTGLRGLANAAGSAASQHASSGHAISTAVLFRGLRLKVGLDVGHVHATIVPSTGRVDYRCVPRRHRQPWQHGPVSAAASDASTRIPFTAQGPGDEPGGAHRRQGPGGPSVGDPRSVGAGPRPRHATAARVQGAGPYAAQGRGRGRAAGPCDVGRGARRVVSWCSFWSSVVLEITVERLTNDALLQSLPHVPE